MKYDPIATQLTQFIMQNKECSMYGFCDLNRFQ
jgi:hypothetical protein